MGAGRESSYMPNKTRKRAFRIGRSRTGLGLFATAPNDSGVARFKNTGSYCAVVASVSVEETVAVHKLWAAVDAGLVINPAGVVSQIEGGMLQAASWALKETVPTDGTRLVAESWRDYPILSFAETPATHVEIIAAPEFPSTGVGEVSLGPTAGAIANAVANALGLRVRDIPLTRERLMKVALAAE